MEYSISCWCEADVTPICSSSAALTSVRSQTVVYPALWNSSVYASSWSPWSHSDTVLSISCGSSSRPMTLLATKHAVQCPTQHIHLNQGQHWVGGPPGCTPSLDLLHLWESSKYGKLYRGDLWTHLVPQTTWIFHAVHANTRRRLCWQFRHASLSSGTLLQRHSATRLSPRDFLHFVTLSPWPWPGWY